MHARPKAIIQVVGIMAALWLLPAPGIVLVALFRGWTPATVEMARTIYAVFAVLFVLGIVVAAYTLVLEHASQSDRGRSFIRGVSSLAMFWLAFVILYTIWEGIAHLSLTAWEFLTTAVCVGHLIMAYHTGWSPTRKT